jgi:hypothetical protein
MSHFTVLIFGSDVDKQLAPFHEFECTGIDNEYVQDVDETEDARKDYEESTRYYYQSPSGELVSKYDNQFYREPTEEEKKKIDFGTGSNGELSWHSNDWGDGLGYRAKVNYLPDGWTEVEKKMSEMQSFIDYVNKDYGCKSVLFGEKPDTNRNNFDCTSGPHKYRYVQLKENGDVDKVIRRTNPNSKWDWYKIGGRWTGYLKLAKDYTGIVGTPGLDTNNAKSGHCDSTMKGHIDFDAMRREARVKAEEKWDDIHNIIDGHLDSFVKWDDMLNKHKDDINMAREEYSNQEAIKLLRTLDHWNNVEDFLVSREDYAQDAEDGSISTFAVIKDGKWHEKGKMGWWASVSNEMDKSEWNKRFRMLLDSVPDDTMLTLVDCHI